MSGNERDWTVGLDWLGRVLLIGWRGLGRIAVGLKFLA